MQHVKRKRVTRVGSGAFAVYLPKKWIDNWTPDQQRDREVDLHLINQSLLIVPAIQEDHARLTSAPRPEVVRALLMSAYVRGHRQVTITPTEGKFDPDTIALARDFLRTLDERLRSTVGPERIGFTLQRELAAPFNSGNDLVQLMASKLHEMLDLAGECVETYASSPERALHASRLLVSINDQDLSRLWAQALRLVATLELPLQRVTEFQLMNLAASDLLCAGAESVDIARRVLAEYGLTIADLDYPRAELLTKVRAPAAPSFAAQEMQRAIRTAVRDAQSLLRRVSPVLGAPDVELLMFLGQDADKAMRNLQEKLRRISVDRLEDPADLASVMWMHHLAQPAQAMLACLDRMVKHAIELGAAQPAPLLQA